MKLSITIAAVMLCGLAYCQEFPRDLKLAVKESRIVAQDTVVKLNPHLSFYSKNYHKIFKYDTYNLDVLSHAARAVFFDFNNNNSLLSDPNIPHIFRVMPLPGVNVDGWAVRPCD